MREGLDVLGFDPDVEHVLARLHNELHVHDLRQQRLNGMQPLQRLFLNASLIHLRNRLN